MESIEKNIIYPTKPGHLKMNLQFFAEGGEGLEDLVDAGEETTIEETQGIETGVEDQGIANPDGIEQSKAFAKRLRESTEKALASERQKWEEENSQKYGGYDKYQKVTDYLTRTSGVQDIDTLLEMIEQEELQKKAEEQGVSPDVVRRIEELEGRAQLADKLQEQMAAEEAFKLFRKDLESFAKEREVDSDLLHQKMQEYDTGNFELAYRAMKAEEWEQKAKQNEQEVISNYLKSKQAPKTDSVGNPATSVPATPKTFEEARKGALSMLSALRNNQ